MPFERRLRLLEIAVQHRVVLLEDDPYGELYFDHAPPPSLLALSAQVPGSTRWVAHVSSLSKILAPGLRLGWLVAPHESLERAVIAKQGQDAQSGTHAQVIAGAYLESGRLTERLPLLRTAYAGRARAMTTALRTAFGDRLGFAEPSGGMFVWARLSTGTAVALEQAAQGVSFVRGEAFYATTPDPSTLRLSFATQTPETIAVGVQRLRSAFDRAFA
jgi:DNA-binding transcriptional MocR family regulator